MSTPINDGGPAFPSDYIPGTATTPGMTLRDWFAGQALCGLAARPDPNCESDQEAAEWCYAMADTMVDTRNKKIT